MLYEVGAIPRDNQAMYEEIFCFLAKLIFKEHHQEFMILGIISMSGDNYCYIIAFLSADFQSILSKVILPDGTKMELEKQNLETRFDLMSFYVNVRIKSVNSRCF
jgi:hypothetical protein